MIPDRREQGELFEGPEREAVSRALIDQLIAATRLYDSKEKLVELLAFTCKLRAFAPFNAMLLHIQKPGLTFAATATDWHGRFGRVPKRGTRPLLILRTMGPVDFVFDLQDTEGKQVPASAWSFPTFGDVNDGKLYMVKKQIEGAGFRLVGKDLGDDWAGWIECMHRSKAPKGRHIYRVGYNSNHAPATQLVTLAHELAHMFLGHLGADPGRRVPDRSDRPHDLREVEAETAAYLVAKRNGIAPKSEQYLSSFKGSLEQIDVYSVMRAANAIETVMGVSAQSYWKT